MALTQADIARVKALGFLRNRGTERFSGRIVPAGTVFTAAELSAVAELAGTYGNGKVIPTVRMTLELPGIPYEKIDEVIAAAGAQGLSFGGTGAKLRPVTSCKGTTCVFGMYDTQALARTIHERYYLGWTKVALPHKFKIAVGGCPNSCIKPSLNDFGIEGRRTPDGVRFQLYIGGTWGRTTRMGSACPCLVEQEEIFPLLEKTMLWFRENAYQKERLGAAIDRLGEEALFAALERDDLLARKDAILSAPLLQKP